MGADEGNEPTETAETDRTESDRHTLTPGASGMNVRVPAAARSR